MRRRALVCSYGPPQPDRDSGSRRLFDHLEFLVDAGWVVDFVAASGYGEPRYVDALRQRGIAVFGGDGFDGLAEYGDYDIALFSFWQNAEQYIPRMRRLSPRTRIVVDSVDMQLLRDARRVFASGDGLLANDYAGEMIGELNVYAAADLVLTVSAKEAELIGEFLADPGIAVSVPDNEGLVLSGGSIDERRGVLFVGGFAHPPNVQAVEYLCKQVLPRVDVGLLDQHPISIVGAGVDDLVRQYARGIPQVELVGWVPAVTPYLERARVNVVPLLYGAGTKRKLLQSLMIGTPAVATTIGAEGLNLIHGTHLLIGDDPASFAEGIERLLQDAPLAQRLAAAAYEHVAPLHSRDAVQKRFLGLLGEVMDRPAKGELLPDPLPSIYAHRNRYQENQKVIPNIRELVCQIVPAGEQTMVLSDGCDELLRAHGDARHLPSDSYGRWTGHFASAEDAVAKVRAAVLDQPTYVVLPCTNFWMLELWPELAAFFATDAAELARDRYCVLFAFNSPRRVDPPVVQAKPEPAAAALPSARLIAFYLPQFHPIPENDEWWGEGFTEWTNVTRAEPLFPGHYQPHIPADLGFYDLRLPEIRKQQAELARAHGIGAFCYYHYWFGGRRLLERPFEDVLRSGEPDFPFCLCWANEPWSRRWDGGEHDVLQPQVYSEEDDLAHIRWLLPALSDRRAVKVDGKPVFIVYQAKELPDPARTIALWRREVRAAGLEGLHLIAVETGWDAGWDATEVGFDAKLLFMPQFTMLATTPAVEVESEALRVYDYQQAWPLLSRPAPVKYRRYPTVFPSWDNTARRGEQGWIVHNSTPEAYEAWLSQTISEVQQEPADHRLVFLNAWNEWAEGAHLEPDQKNGRAYLEATRRALEAATTATLPGAGEERAPRMVVTTRAVINGTSSSASAGAADGAGVERGADGRLVRALAFYLPQFHPIRETAEWWGPDSSAWTNVATARPLFPGHYQPHLPANLGFYDLRVPEVRAKQAELARAYGIEGFCYWHYWLGGRRVLERPFEEVLASGEPDFPFCLAWANESWSRRNSGELRDLLVRQEYSPEDDVAHGRWLARAFADPRYIRVDGRPIFAVYKPDDLPAPGMTLETWRQECASAGVGDPFILAISSLGDRDYRNLGFDGNVGFQPNLAVVADVGGDHGPKVHDYLKAQRLMRHEQPWPAYPSIFVSWDNTPKRAEHGVVLTGSTPAEFEIALTETVAKTLRRPFEDRLVFINAWNAWGDGNHLEPDQRHGLGNLEAVRNVLYGNARPDPAKDDLPASLVTPPRTRRPRRSRR